MRIEDTLRRKDFREAADAGLLFWRQNFTAFLPFFAVPFLICAFALRLLPDNLKYFSWLVIWWLKPLFDRIILHIISVRFFENSAGLKRLCRGLGNSLYRGIIGDLLWRRFSPVRSAVMPVRVLEKNIKSGYGFIKRKKLLEKGNTGYCFLLTVWGIAVETALLVGQMLFVITMAELMTGSFLSSIESFSDVEVLFYAAYCINYILVETIYVCMGFSLYINSRIEVEGWDIEITFRNLTEKLKGRGKNAIIAVLLLACLFMPLKTHAADDHIPLATLQTIFESPEFGSEEDSWGIRLRNPPQPGEIAEFNRDRMQHLRQIFAYFLRFLIICGTAAFLVVIFIYLRKFIYNKTGRIDSPSAKPLNVNYAEDPELLLKKAVSFHEQGEIRLAWGYCAAAAIHSWQHYHGITFPPDATESDCANIVNLPAFSKLVKHWVFLAYAGRFPPAGSFEEAVIFCEHLRTKNG
jgi:hypothetical protein